MKGHSPSSNGGRPKLPAELKEAFQTEGYHALDVLLSVMRNPEARAADRIRCAEIILDRGYGKPRQAIDLGADAEGGGVIFMPDVVLIGEPEE